MKRRAACLVVLGFAAAGTHPLSAQTQADLDVQAGSAFQKADTALNQVYTQLLAKVSPAGQAMLRTAQRTWVQFRDQECDFETAGSRGGSVYPMAFASCKEQVTLARTKQLRFQLNCPEGDVGCGGQ